MAFVASMPSLALVFLLAACNSAWPLGARRAEPRQNDAADLSAAMRWEALKARAIWLRPDTLLWPSVPLEDTRWVLLEETDGGARRQTALESSGVFDAGDPDFERYPYLAGYLRLRSDSLSARAGEILRGGRFAIVANTGESVGNASAETSTVQTYPLLDALYSYDGDDLGPQFGAGGVPSLKLWAPTARAVRLLVFAAAHDAMPATTLSMTAEGRGVWSARGEPSWRDAFYLYEVDVYVPATGRVETNRVTDPYSVSLSRNSERSQIVDLTDAALKPVSGWDTLRKPALARAEDITLYELHVRDFSLAERGLSSEDRRGTFLAFADAGSDGMRHLRSLAEAGLTHVHLMPVFDIATVNEDKGTWRTPLLPPAEERSPDDLQAAITAIKDQDGYNWGYDPLHYNVPEGSYATEADGPARILEMRTMVASLADAGLRVVMDVVYNHTSNAGQDERSILDRIVPGYYYRLDREGAIQRSTCCPDTASEHAMMEKLLVDSVVQWARQYKIDGFRFDLMGHHTTGNLVSVRRALDALTLEKDGVDGASIYLYGEGWKFGSLDAILPQEACTQLNAAGLGVGTFNDRLRDRARGGNYERGNLANPGFLTGLGYDFNGLSDLKMVPPDPAAQDRLLLEYGDLVKLGLAGNLRDFRFEAADGQPRRGDEVDYGGSPAGYAAAPRETINYVSAHDNFTLWDHIAAKAPLTATVAERTAMQRLGIALVALGQGIPFFDAGIELLRSKSGDDNSYDSGDAFNGLDYSMQTHAYGLGTPSQVANGDDALAFWRPRLAAENLRATPDAIAGTAEFFKAMLRLRKSSPLFRLGSTREIQERLAYFDRDGGAKPGVIAYRLEGAGLDPDRRAIIVAFNVTKASVVLESRSLREPGLKLMPELERLGEGAQPVLPALREVRLDAISGSLVLPPRTVVVLEAAH